MQRPLPQVQQPSQQGVQDLRLPGAGRTAVADARVLLPDGEGAEQQGAQEQGRAVHPLAGRHAGAAAGDPCGGARPGPAAALPRLGEPADVQEAGVAVYRGSVDVPAWNVLPTLAKGCGEKGAHHGQHTAAMRGRLRNHQAHHQGRLCPRLPRQEERHWRLLCRQGPQEAGHGREEPGRQRHRRAQHPRHRQLPLRRPPLLLIPNQREPVPGDGVPAGRGPLLAAEHDGLLRRGDGQVLRGRDDPRARLPPPEGRHPP
mmetsp:Transcript_20561/g.78839  ORF Transcript_20561/g.78839 Transcript_20561/m.78839 type:complete len:258 (-) Transcript_20561:27-800(-)